MRLLLPLLLLLVLYAPLATAQESALPPVIPGTRVRVQLEWQSREVEGAALPQELRGTVLAASADSLTLEIHPGVTPFTVAIGSIRRLDRSLGVPSRLESALRGMASGALWGVIYFPLYTPRNDESDSGWDETLTGVAVGAVVGAGVGVLRPEERWERVWLGDAEAVRAQPVGLPIVAVGAGIGLAGEEEIVGPGVHALASVRLAQLTPSLQLRGEALYEHAELDGTPFDCQIVREDCTGREERVDRVGAGASLVWAGRPVLRVLRPYVPAGVGIYHREVEISEFQAPTLAEVSDEFSSTGVGAHLGFGTGFDLGRVTAFAEVRTYLFADSEGEAGYIPFTLGVAF